MYYVCNGLKLLLDEEIVKLHGNEFTRSCAARLKRVQSTNFKLHLNVNLFVQDLYCDCCCLCNRLGLDKLCCEILFFVLDFVFVLYIIELLL